MKKKIKNKWSIFLTLNQPYGTYNLLISTDFYNEKMFLLEKSLKIYLQIIIHNYIQFLLYFIMRL